MSDAQMTEAFNRNLAARAKSEQHKFYNDIGQAIQPIMARYGFSHNDSLRFDFAQTYAESMYTGRMSGWQAVVSTTRDLDEKIKSHFQKRAMEQFEEVLKNFAWALQQQQQQSNGE